MPENQNSIIYVSLIIPCFNEAERIGYLVNGIQAFEQSFNKRYELIVVNDGSKDNTVELLKGNSVLKNLTKGSFEIVNKEKNEGKGFALRDGVLMAKGLFVLTLDADMSTLPTEFINWERREVFSENKILIGSREHKDSTIESSVHRKYIGRIFNLIIRILTPLKISDTQCGFKLYPKKVAHELFGEMECSGWEHDVELLIRANKRNIEIVEMPVKWDSVEGSKVSVIKDSIKMLLGVLKLRRKLL